MRLGTTVGALAEVNIGNGRLDLVHFRLNASQEEAVIMALREPVSLIHGPPGTGKTRTAAALALTFARQNSERSVTQCEYDINVYLQRSVNRKTQ